MPHVSNSKGQVRRRGQMNRKDVFRKVAEGIPRDDLRSAYGGDENVGRDKTRRIGEKSGRTPVR